MCPPVSKHKILIVEDEPILAFMIERVLLEHGYQIDREADGESGMERCKCKDYDVVISDVRLPGIDGVVLCRNIKKQCICRVILMSASSLPEIQEAALNAGADHFLLKPFSIKELVAIIES